MTQYLTGWLILIVLAAAVSQLFGCAKWEHDPLDVYHADPKAMEIPVMTFAVIGF